MKKSQGYSMIELVMVIVIIGIVSVFTYIKYPSSTPFSVNSTADQLKADIRLAQTQAMSITNVVYSITLNSTNYTIQYNTVPPATPVTVTVLTGTLPSGVTLSSTSSPITFDQNGVPITGITVTITVSGSGTPSKGLTVNGVTGYVSG